MGVYEEYTLVKPVSVGCSLGVSIVGSKVAERHKGGSGTAYQFFSSYWFSPSITWKV
jgi:hypothetical protein